MGVVEIGSVGGMEIFVVTTVLGVLAAVWVYRDASRHRVRHPILWAISIAFLFFFYALPGVAALIVYLLLRRDLSTTEDG